MTKYPNVTVKLILRCRGEIFMLQHRKNGAYDFPGGRMEWGESIEGTLRRELQEELGYALPDMPQLFDVWNYVANDGSRHSVQLQYLLDIPEKPIFTIAEEAAGLWLDKAFFRERWQEPAKVNRLFTWQPH